MPRTRSAARLAFIVPFYNEERCLPRLIESLRSQHGAEVPVVFVNNGSTDGSPELVRRCEEVRGGRWHCIDESHVGKFYALQAGTSYCVNRYGAEYVGCFDADAYHGSSEWLRTGCAILDRALPEFGYTYSPFTYVGFDRLPRFRAAYLAYQAGLNQLIESVGWGLNGLGFIAAADLVSEYWACAAPGSCIDMPLSLFLLSRGRQPVLHPGCLVSSGRRIMVNAENFMAWCFFRGGYYASKDINSPRKVDLNQSTVVDDLREDQIDEFFERRATKVICRDFIPLAIFDTHGVVFDRLGIRFGNPLANALRVALAPLADVEAVMHAQYENLVARIEAHPSIKPLVSAVADLMRAQHRADRGASTLCSHSNGN